MKSLARLIPFVVLFFLMPFLGISQSDSSLIRQREYIIKYPLSSVFGDLFLNTAGVSLGLEVVGEKGFSFSQEAGEAHLVYTFSHLRIFQESLACPKVGFKVGLSAVGGRAFYRGIEVDVPRIFIAFQHRNNFRGCKSNKHVKTRLGAFNRDVYGHFIARIYASFQFKISVLHRNA